MKHLEKIITKELLRRILPKETKNLSDDFIFYIDEDCIVFRDEGETLFDYNIYKFAFKCKEWALSKGYSHLSGKDDIYEKLMTIWTSHGFEIQVFDIGSEPDIKTLMQKIF
jgi:hypothetical protein